MSQHRTDGRGHYSFAWLLATMLLAALLLTVGTVVQAEFVGTGLALAGDDDDDDGGSGGGFSGGGSGGSSVGGGGGETRPLQPPRVIIDLLDDERPQPPRRQQPRRVAPLPTHAPSEIIAVGLSDDDVAALVARGYTVIERGPLAQLSESITRFGVPRGTSLDDARAEIGALNADAVTELNHFYRTSTADTESGEPPGTCEGLGCAEKQLIAWPFGRAATCGAEARIGLIDTGINPDHETFKGSRLEVLPLLPEEARQSGRQHGTAVAAILLGSAESRAPGLLPDATLIAVDAFYRAGRKDVRSDAYTVVKALDMLVDRNVSIINLSFAGPDNDVLKAMVARVAESGAVMVAAAGNRGPKAAPAYPAAYPGVVAVTAINQNKKVYRRAGRGDHIDVAAPGVEVWTAASVRGARTKTGTSYAVPFVTATVALMEHGLGLKGHDAIVAELAARALDLGKPGKDNVYGYGLVQAQDICGAPAARGSG